MLGRWKVPAITIGAAVLVLATGLTLASPALAAPGRTASRALATNAREQAQMSAREFLSHLKVGAPMRRAVSHGHVTNPSLTSSNWSGYADYVDTAGSFTKVSATWLEPTLVGSC